MVPPAGPSSCAPRPQTPRGASGPVLVQSIGLGAGGITAARLGVRGRDCRIGTDDPGGAAGSLEDGKTATGSIRGDGAPKKERPGDTGHVPAAPNPR